MAETPPSDRTGPQDLHEVERALSVLSGRHPEHERARREDDEKRRLRAEKQESVARVESKRVSARRAVLVGIALPVAGLFVFIAVFGRRELARRARIDAVSDSFRAYGFVPIETSLRGSTGALEATAEPGCLLAVSTDTTKPLTITRAGTSQSTAAPALFCTCTSERIGVSAPVGGEGGIALLRADTAMIGGTRAFGFLPFTPGSKLPVDQPCLDASLDAWIGAKHLPQLPVSDEWLEQSRHVALKQAGFHLAARAKGTDALTALDLPAESCLIARSAEDGDALSVRPRGETQAIVEGAGAVAHCRQAATTFVISHLGKGELFLLVAPAAKVGGLLGLAESAEIAGLTLGATSLPAADRGWDAEQTLVASAIPPTLVKRFDTAEVPPDPDARVVAVSVDVPGSLFFELAPTVKSACLPALGPKQRETLCVFSGVQKWKTPPNSELGSFGVARSKLPFWLFSMQAVKEPAALLGIAKVLRIARSLARQGFTPTTLEALIERPNGVEVLGRTGEDAVVAIGVAPSEPWVYPLSEDAAWDIDGAPQLALVKPLQKVTLVTPAKHLPPIAQRRTVVFRRQAPTAP